MTQTFFFMTGGPQTGNISTSMTSSDTVSAVFSDRILVFHMDERVRCPPKSTSVSQRGWDDGSKTDDDISVSPLIWTYLLIEELCQSSDLCLKYPYITASITSGTLRSDTFPKFTAQHSADQVRPCYLSLHAVRFMKKTVDLSLG